MTEKEFDELIKPESLKFLSEHINDDPDKLALKFQGIKELPIRAISEQIVCHKKAANKLPRLSGKKILYEKVALEQSSGEMAAGYKAELLHGDKAIDLTGGFGIDDIFICRNFKQLIYCEQDSLRIKLFSYNLRHLGIQNIEIKPGNSIETLHSYKDDYFDWIYVDPSRRDERKRYIGLHSCSPDVIEFEETFLKKAAKVMIKASPVLELEEARKQLSYLKEFIVVSVDNECKEVLLILSRNKDKDDLLIKASAISSREKSIHTITSYYSEKHQVPSAVETCRYFFEPDVSIIKARLTKSLTNKYPLYFLNSGTDYLTSDNYIKNFPGRQFIIEKVLPYKKQTVIKYLKEQSIEKANIARRDFPDAPETIRKNFSLNDGGDNYLFCTKDLKDNLIVIFCRKLK